KEGATMRQFVLRSGGWLAAATLLAAGALGSLALGSAALSQEQAVAPPKDAIFARKILMDAIGHNMDELAGILDAAKVDLNQAHETADRISVRLMASPPLFPPATNQWKAGAERDPGTDTFAAPEVWTNYADFYKRAQDAAKIAYQASRADTDAEFR